jgi:hypothetical protein
MRTIYAFLLTAAVTAFVFLDSSTLVAAYQFRNKDCRSQYVKLWKPGAPHKAIAVVETPSIEACGFSEQYASLNVAKSHALKECRKWARRLKVNPDGCRIVEFK